MQVKQCDISSQKLPFDDNTFDDIDSYDHLLLGTKSKFNDDADKKLRIKENNRIIFGRVLTVSNELPNIVYKSKLSISHILSYSVGTLLTAYENNIVSHYKW